MAPEVRSFDERSARLRGHRRRHRDRRRHRGLAHARRAAVSPDPLRPACWASHVLPGVIAQELCAFRWVALITHLIAALVASAVDPAVDRPLHRNGAADRRDSRKASPPSTRYRVGSRGASSSRPSSSVSLSPSWSCSPPICRSFPLWGQIVYVVLSVLGPVAVDSRRPCDRRGAPPRRSRAPRRRVDHRSGASS